MAIFGVFAVRNLHPFLALQKPIHAEILVVEGWLPDYALRQVVQIFRDGSYRKIITTGGPLERGSYLSDYQTFAELSRATLIKMGFSQKDVVASLSPPVEKDRTFATADRVADLVRGLGEKDQAINVCTLGTHARRSLLLFQEALGNEFEVGVISIAPEDYSPNEWWRSSQGVRTVISETIAYLYAKVFVWVR